MYEIPLDPIPAQRFNVVLGNQECAFNIYWRDARLYCDMDVADSRIATGNICRNRQDILQSPVSAFHGKVFFADTRGREDPHYKGLGERWLLIYQPEGAE